METLWQDLRYGLRMLRKDKGFSVFAVLTLALGIGANSTVFSWANATLLDPIPGMAKPSDVVYVAAGVPRHASTLSYPDFQDLQHENHVFSGMTGFGMVPMSLTGGERQERITGTLVSSNYFDVLQVRPALGRGFLQVEDAVPGGAPVAVISYGLWESRFARNSAIVGQTLELNRHRYTVVGVAPRDFQGSYTGLRVDVWVPIAMADQFEEQTGLLTARNTRWLGVLGRLKAGVSREEAQAALESQFQVLARQHPESHQGLARITAYPLWRAPGANRIFSAVMPMLMGVAFFLLLLTCANVANLTSVRAFSRMREMALRVALGASRVRLIRQLLLESLLLSLAGGAVALGITLWDKRFFMDMAPPSDLPIWISVHVDQRVFFFTLMISIATAVMFGILPALRASGSSPNTALKEQQSNIAGGRKARLSGMLAVAQIALSLILLVSASLFFRSLQKAENSYPGFNPRNVLLATYDLFPDGLSKEGGIALDRQILARVKTVPGVRSAALADWVPLGFSSSSASFTPEGYAAGKNEVMNASVADVSPGYFQTMEIPLTSGRDFTEQDGSNAEPVVIVTQALADSYWKGLRAVGRRLKIHGEWRTVVGVTRNSNLSSLSEKTEPFVYLPIYQQYSATATLHVRTNGNPMGEYASVEAAVHEVQRELPLFDVGTLHNRIQAASTIQRVAGPASGVLGVIGLVLATLGIYGVLAFRTKQRRQEIGIRMTLGAQRGDVRKLILGEGAKFALAGLAIGLAGALGLARAMSGLIFGVSAMDPVTFIAIPLLLSSVTLLACYLPARRAMRVDPVIALRYE